MPVTELGALTTFDPTRLTAMGQYTDPTQANLITGAREFGNAQNYRRHEMRATVGEESVTLPLKQGTKKQGGTFDRFGLLTATVGGQLVKIYLDDISYTTGR